MRIIALLTLLACSAVQAAPASEASVEQMLKVMKMESIVENMKAQMKPVFAATEAPPTGLQPSPLTQEYERIYRAKYQAWMEEEISWKKLKPQYVRIYQESYSQEEIDGMLAFYKSPAGQATINKMPVVAQKTVAISLRMMQVLPTQVKVLSEEAFREARQKYSK
jgi:hypothetical protein